MIPNWSQTPSMNTHYTLSKDMFSRKFRSFQKYLRPNNINYLYTQS